MFGDIFCKLLDERDITAYKLSQATGISNGNLSEYKSGAKIPTAENLIKIADYFKVSTDYLLGRTEGDNFNANAITNSVIAQGHNSNAVNGSDPSMTTKELELFRIFRMLNTKEQNQILQVAFSLEDAKCEIGNRA